MEALFFNIVITPAMHSSRVNTSAHGGTGEPPWTFASTTLTTSPPPVSSSTGECDCNYRHVWRPTQSFWTFRDC